MNEIDLDHSILRDPLSVYTRSALFLFFTQKTRSQRQCHTLTLSIQLGRLISAKNTHDKRSRSGITINMRKPEQAVEGVVAIYLRYASGSYVTLSAELSPLIAMRNLNEKV